MSSYAQPQDLQEAVARLASGPCRVLAGGTDIYPMAGTAIAGDVLDLTGLAPLRGLRPEAGGLRIGACATWSEIAEADLPPALAGLQAAALQVGGRQVQNSGTLGGNLCNASPAADGVPPLLTLDAEVEIVSVRGTRRLGLAQFLTGPRKTALAADELLTAVWLPAAALQGEGRFLKLGARAYLVISIAMVAVRLQMEQGRIGAVALAVGACGPVAQRLPGLEAALLGLSPAEAAARITTADLAALTPIDDIRASAEYRREAAAELLRRAIGGAGTESGSEPASEPGAAA